MGRAVRPNERERMSQSVHWRISYLLTVNGSGKRGRPPSRIIGGPRSAIRGQIAAGRTPSRRRPSSPNGANGMSGPSSQRYAVASIEGPSSPWRVFDRTGERTRVGARSEPDLHCGRRTSFKSEIKLSSFGPARPGTSFEEPPQARLVKIAHRRLAAWLDPFGMLPPQVVVNLSLKLGHGVGRVTD